MRKKPSEIQPRSKNHEQFESQESFRQNFSFAEKILDPSGIFPQPRDDHDIRKVTREKVEDMLYAQELKPEIMDAEGVPHRIGPQGVNQWIWENLVQREIPQSVLREFLNRGLRNHNAPHVFFRKYEYVRKLLVLTANSHGISPSQVQNEHLLDPQAIHQGIQHIAADRFALSLFNFLMQKSIQAGISDQRFPVAKTPHEQPPLHPRILSFKQHMEEKGFSPKHVRNTITQVHQLMVWLCSNVRVFVGTSPETISIFQIQNEHLLMYRTHKLRLVKLGHCSRITFTHSIYAIRSFYYYLQKQFGYHPPLRRFCSVNAPRYSLRDLPTDQQIGTFFRVVEQYAENPLLEQIGYRFMLHLGLRLSEVAKIQWKDINLGTSTIVIHSKGKKTHVLPLSSNLSSLLHKLQNQLLATYLMGGKPSNNRHHLYEYFKLYTMIADWPFPGGVHIFRHLFITRLAHKGVLPQALKELARLIQVDTVGLYLHMAHQDQHMISQINLLNYE